MSGRRSRTKGHSYEREIAACFRKNGFPDAKRHLEYQSEMACGYDLDGVGILKPQLKRGKQYAPITKIEEVQVCEDFIPCLITKGDRKRDVIVLYLDDFLRIIQDVGILWDDKNLIKPNENPPIAPYSEENRS